MIKRIRNSLIKNRINFFIRHSFNTINITMSAGNSFDDALVQKCINSVRVLSAETVEKAKSGHPGAPMGCAPIAHVLFSEVMKFSPSNPKWANRDRFVLSNGHACALLYSMLHLTGYNLTIDDLKNFRQIGSQTPGHPENFLTPGVEVSTGPLGQGLSNAVGMAMAEKQLAASFNQDGFNVVDNFTYVICGDGCLQEGVTAEASSLAGHLGLGKLIVCYDDNLITIDGSTDLSFTEDVNMRYASYGWHVQTVDDVNNINALRIAISNAKAETNRPSMIKIRTIIGQGSVKQGSHATHGSPLGAPDIAQLKEKYGMNPEEHFVVPEDVQSYYKSKGMAGVNAEEEWNSMFSSYSEKHPELASEFIRRMSGFLPAGWKDNLPVYAPGGKEVGTRNRSEEVLNACALALPEMIGGSADLTPSNLTALKNAGDFQKNSPQGRYIRFGVREHAMAAICNGIWAYGGLKPFCATFLNFIGYALGSVRLSALSQFGVLYIMTHDSIGLGEDGPTHQPIEMLEVLRATPNLFTIRPCDGNETVGAYIIAMENPKTPTVMAYSRQAVPTLEGSSAEKTLLGAYVMSDINASEKRPDLVIVATGTEVSLAITVANKLAEDNLFVRVVSMPCCELFDQQSQDYKLYIFPEGSPVMSLEALGTRGWKEYAHAPYGMTRFGASGPGAACYKLFGFTTETVCVHAKEVISFYGQKGAPSLVNVPQFPSYPLNSSH